MSDIRIEPVVEGSLPPPSAPLGFGLYFSDRMFTQRYDASHGWHDASIGPWRSLVMDPASQVFHNGQQIFDGTKAYRRPDGRINLFRPDRNAERFNRSALRMGMPEVPADFHVEAIRRLIELEHRWVPSAPDTALYIRPVMIATEKALAIRAPKEYLHYIILSPVAPYFAGGFASVAVYVSDEYVRAVRGGTGEAKTPGNYAGSVAGTELAIAKGYQQVLWLDAVERRYVDEVGAMNIAFVYEGKHLRTPALTGAILHGVTRESVLVLARDLGYTATEERIDFQEVLADIERGRITEIFGMGTGAVIAPVGRLGYRGRDILVNGGEPGPVARQLFEQLTGIQYGRLPDVHGWTTTLDVPPA